MQGGYTGHILFVNLSEGSIKEEELPEESYRDFLGCVGMGAKILYERMKAKVDPLGPDNLLGFMTGPLTGSAVPMAGKYVVVAKSPLTGTWGEAFGGGYFGAELKAAGYDGIFFSGISPKPVYLWVVNGKAELRKATHLWGKDTTEIEDLLRQELGDKAVRVACIGPAGESMSLIAAVINDKGRAAARCGLGAVMGSKLLKAIAVRGDKKLEVADARRLTQLRKNAWGNFKKDDFRLPSALNVYGTCGLTSGSVISGLAPIKNWTLFGEQAFPIHPKISGDSMMRYQERKYTCDHCSVACGGIVTVKEGPFVVNEGHKPEFETVAAFGTQCLNDNVEAIIKANDICNRYGLDTISAGLTIAFAMECYEREVIGKEETEGIELMPGNAMAMIAMLEKLAKREGFGAVLADGVKKAAERIGKGSEQWAVHVHGQEPGNCDSRLQPARGVGYIVEAAPGKHMPFAVSACLEGGIKAIPDPELQIPKAGHFDFKDKNKGVQYALGYKYGRVDDASGACIFSGYTTYWPLVEYISAVTGWDFTMGEALTAGHRIATLQQLFINREGLSAKDFSLPNRMKDTLTTGPMAGITIDFDLLRRNYYEAMGWDTETGKPTMQTRQKLGI